VLKEKRTFLPDPDPTESLEAMESQQGGASENDRSCPLPGLFQNKVVNVRRFTLTNDCLSITPTIGDLQIMFTNTSRKGIRCGASLAVAIAALVGANAASAQNAVVDLNVTLSPITLLYYFSTVNVTVPSSAMAGLLCGTGSVSAIYSTSAANCDVGATGALNATGSGTGLTANGAIGTSPGGFSIASVPLTLQNVWAVRAIGGTSASTTVTISLGASTSLLLAGTGPQSIVISTPTVSTAPATGGSGTTAVTFLDPGLVTAQQGSVGLSLNLTGATAAGLYSTTAAATGDSNYILTVSGT
jgi:hypothetical protein